MQQTKKIKMADAISPYLAVSCGLRLLATEVVFIPTYDVISYDKVDIMTTLGFQWLHFVLLVVTLKAGDITNAKKINKMQRNTMLLSKRSQWNQTCIH